MTINKLITIATLVGLGFTTACSAENYTEQALTHSSALKASAKNSNSAALKANMYSTITQKTLIGEISINGLTYNDSALEVEVTGFDIKLDPQSSPFLGYTQGKIPQIKKITIAADTIEISGILLFPGIDITLIAKQITFTKNAVLNTSAPAYPLFLETLKIKEASEKSIAKKGIQGGNISLVTSDLKIADSTNPILITDGGQGQNAALGAKGADMPPVPSLKKISYQGKSCDVLHEIYYIEEEAFDKECGPRGKTPNNSFQKSPIKPQAIGSCRAPTIMVKYERGLKKWPEPPTDSIPGGTPGAGGDAGNILIQFSKNAVSSSLNGIQNSPTLFRQNTGSIGVPATPALGGQVAGSGCYVFIEKDKVTDTRIYENGKSLTGAQTSQELSSKGAFNLKQGHLEFPLSYAQMKYKYIADLYIERNFKKAFATALELEKEISRETTSKTDESYLEVVELKAQLQALITRMMNNRDYYGFLQSEIPELSVFFAVKDFNESLNSTLNTIYLTEMLVPILKKKDLSLKESASSLDSLSQQIYADLLSQNNIENQITNLMVNIDLLESSEKRIHAHLLELEAQLRRQAEGNIASKNRWLKIKKLINSVVSLTKVIPVYQPTLAIAGSLAQQLTKIDENKNLGDYIESASEIYKSIDSLTDKETLAQSKKSYNDFKKAAGDSYDLIRSHPIIPENATPKEIEKIKFEHYKHVSKETLNFAKETYAKLKPLYEALQKTSEDFKSKSVPISEIEQEFNRLKAMDPIFKTFESTFNEHIYLKAEIYKNTSQLTDSFAELVQRIQESKILQEKTAQFFLANSDIYSNDLVIFLEDLQERRFEKLDYLYNNIKRAYEYAYQKGINSPFDSQALKKEILKISGKNLSLDERLSVLRSIYLGNINSLFEQLRTQVGMITPTYRSDIISLSESDLAILNAQGSVTVKIPESSIPFLQSSYIHKIELFPEYTQLNSKDYSQTSIVQLSLGKTAKLKTKSQEFNYILNNSLLSLKWSTQTTWHRANTFSERYSPNIPALNLESLYGIKGIKVDIFDLLSKSPALVDLVISKHDKGPNIDLRNLDIKLEVQSY